MAPTFFQPKHIFVYFSLLAARGSTQPTSET